MYVSLSCKYFRSKTADDQHIVALQDALPWHLLMQNSIQVASKVLALTANNLTYARISHLLRWWDAHPHPSSIPVEYSGPRSYGCISVWGYGTVVESNTSIDVWHSAREGLIFSPRRSAPIKLPKRTQLYNTGCAFDNSQLN
ncbi:hypothetical protein B0O99DRAFT_118286 [Bisporella sp. PMI_857]|nr:hypothetical protein B0O99DRAFT_118286 [Bisporella sp. PMI_857]